MSKFTMLKALFLKLSLVAVLTGIHGSAFAQGIVRPAQTGVVQQLPGDEDFLIISGVRYDFDFENIEFLIRGEPFDPGFLEEGMVIRFVVESGYIVRVEVLGPNNLIEGINQN